MRFIDFDSFSPSEAWRQRARLAESELAQRTTHEERMRYIEANSQIWRDLRQELIQQFGSRCWFTDAEETVAQLDTEHFRPKARVVEEDGTSSEGYWWLAFDYQNMRLAGQIPNRQHKRCFFPLLPQSFRANSQNRRWREENPVFLDPIKIDDVNLVSYSEEGAVVPSPSAITPEEQYRVRKTNELLGLSAHPPLVEARQRVWSHCRDVIAQVERLKAEEREYGSSTPRTKAERERLMKELRRMIQARTPLSSVARACIFMSGLSWAQKLVESI